MKDSAELRAVKTLGISVLACIVFLIVLTLLDKIGRTAPAKSSKPEVTVSITGSNNTVIINALPDSTLSYPLKVAEVQKESFGRSYSYEDICRLLLLIEEKAEKYGLTYSQGMTIVNVESDFNVRAVNKTSNATGLCQITQACIDEWNLFHKKQYSLADMKSPEDNLEVGFWYYRHLLTHYKKAGYPIYTLEDAYLAYNVGPNLYRSQHKSLHNGMIFRNGEWQKYSAGRRYHRVRNSWT